ncbi:MAG TPA: MotA/TolQ/ExbB proton channel family protein [Opitutaceae bacterium]|nr:MotA/TolQ/ExbB proton channel family protein [Opitutaceae bacterium]HRJ47174.1 MotA/TolQ/ExbB proton channel family protein [Opitutaceae bacterium]
MSVLDFNLFARGGPMMWVLLVMGLMTLMLCIERALYLHRGQIRSTEFINGIKNILSKRRLVEALTVCEETPGPVAAVVKAALLHAEDEPDKMRFHVQEAAVVELPALERRLGSIAAIAQVAPLVGLLGTILGMVTTFLAFERDYATASALSAGMWQALLSTAGSLMLAIPAHLAHHFLSGRVRAIVRDVEWSANEIMKYLATEYRSAGGQDGPATDKST